MSSPGNSRILERQSVHSKDSGPSVVVVRTEWNPTVVDALEEGCMQTLRESGILRVKTVRVPGAAEIPFAIRRYWESLKYTDDKPHAFIALACIIQGDTPHFDHVCTIASQGTLQLNLTLPVPTIFGVLTVLNESQAWERLGGVHGHKGQEAALTALSMIRLNREWTEKPPSRLTDNLS